MNNHSSLIKSLGVCALAITLSLATQILNAQTGYDIGIQSPTAASLGKYAATPANLYTGKANASIPLVTLTHGDIEVPIILQNNNSGFKVEEIPSWVGHGWNLQAGGVITRTVRGLYDEKQDYGFFHTGKRLYDNQFVDWDNKTMHADSAKKVYDGHIDLEHDLFFFNFQGYSGRFIFYVDQSDNISIKLLDEVPLKITYNVSAHEITTFTITDPSGFRYHFADTETTKSHAEYEDLYGSNNEFLPDDPEYNTSWYLSSITSPNSSRKVTFHYNNHTGNYHDRLPTEERIFGDTSIKKQGSQIRTEDRHDFKLLSFIQTEDLANIKFAHQKVEFTATAGLNSTRSDFDKEGQLNELVYKVDGVTVKKFVFSYDYLKVGAVTGDVTRLKLKDISQFGRNNEEIPGWKFTYTTGTAGYVPLNSEEIDYWGYHNCETSNAGTTVIPQIEEAGIVIWSGDDRDPDWNCAKKGMLETITYPTGGTTTFEYEANTINQLVPSTVTTTQESLNAALTDTDTETTKYFNFTVSSNQTPVLISAVGDVESPALPEVCAEDPQSGPCQAIWDDYNLNCVDASIELETSTGNYITTIINGPNVFNLGNGSYRIVISRGNTLCELGVDLDWSEENFIPASNYERTVGGGRLLKITDHDGISSTNDVITSFKYHIEGDATTSSGYFARPILNHYYDGTLDLTFISSASLAPLGSGSTVAYTEVKETRESAEGNSYKWYTYSSSTDAPPEVFPLGPYSNNEFYRGDLLSEEDFSSTNKSVTKVQNNYSYSNSYNESDAQGNPLYSYRGLKLRNLSQFFKYDDGSPELVKDEIGYQTGAYYAIPKTWKKLGSKVTNVYDQSSQTSYVARENYYYENSTHKQVTKKVEKNSLSSEERVTNYEYAHTQSGNSLMADANMLTQIYSETIEDGSGNDVSKTWTIWSSGISGATGKWLVDKQLVWDTTGTGTAPSIPNGSELEVFDVIKADVYGNPLQIDFPNNSSTAYQWTDDGLYPVGIFNNASDGEVYAYSFAYEDDLGDWVFKDREATGGTIIDVVDDKLRVSDTGAIAGERDRIVYSHPTELSGTVVWELDIEVADSDNWGLLIASGGSAWNDWSTGGNEAAAWASIKNEDFFYYDRDLSGFVEAKSNLTIGQTYSLKIVMNSTTDEVDYYIDGELIAEGITYAKPTGSSGIQKLMIGNYGHTTLGDSWYVDNIRFYPLGTLAQNQELNSEYLSSNSIKSTAGNTSRFTYDNLGRLHKTYNANGDLVSTNDYYYSLDSNTDYTTTDPNYVETLTHYPGGDVKSVSYADGLGREIQSQSRGSSTVLATETLYNDRGLPKVVSRPIERTTTQLPGFYSNGLLSGGQGFTAGNQIDPAAPVHAYFAPIVLNDDEDYAYSQTQYEDTPLARVEKATLPGTTFKMGSGNEIVTDYGLNTSESFTINGKTWSANSLHKTISRDPEGNETIAYTDGWGQTIASGVNMNPTLDDALDDTDDLITKYEYDLRGNLARVEDPRGLVTTYTYNTLNQLTQKQLPDQTHPHTYRYDDKGRLRFHRDPNLDAASDYYYYTKYDELDRPVEVGISTLTADFDDRTDINNQSFPSTGNTVYITYYYDGENSYSGYVSNNATGRLTRVTYNDLNSAYSGGTQYSYNELGLIEWIVQVPPIPTSSYNRKIEYSYDELGRMTRMFFNPPGTGEDHYTWYYYDELGRLEKVTSYGSNAESSALTEAEYTYFADGQVKQLKLGGGAQIMDYEYTVQGWLDEINNGAASGTDIFGMSLSYTNNGNIAQQDWVQSAFSTSTASYYYDYDNANRLTEACYETISCTSNGDYDVTYEYDKNGNLDYINRNGAGAEPDLEFTAHLTSGTNKVNYYSVDGISGATSAQTKYFDYDANGNVTKNEVQGIASDDVGITAASYDWRNLPLSASANGSTITYAYDADGNRVKKTVSGGATIWYIRDATGQTVAAYDGSNNLLFLNIIAGGQIIGQIEN